MDSIAVRHSAGTESSCEVLFDGVASSPPKERASFRMFLPFFRVAPGFPAVLKTWFSTDGRFGGLRHQYFRTQLSDMPATPEDDILTLTQLLEGYHRRTSTETLLQTALFDAQVRAVRAALPRAEAPELSERPDQWLRYANELTLRKRIKALLRGLDTSVLARLCESPERFTQLALDARNRSPTTSRRDWPPLDFRPSWHRASSPWSPNRPSLPWCRRLTGGHHRGARIRDPLPGPARRIPAGDTLTPKPSNPACSGPAARH